MSGIKDTATVILNVNGAQAKQMMSELEDKIKKTEQTIANLKKNMADPKEIEKANKQLKGYKKQLDEMKSATEGVNRALERMSLSKATPRELEKALKTLNRQLKDMVPGSEVWNSHVEKIKALKEKLSEVKAELGEQESLWQRFNNWCTNVWPSIDLLSKGYDSLVGGMRNYVDAYADMEQEMANVRKFTGMTEAQVAALNDRFKEIDTRTSRAELNKLAQEAGRLGKQSEEEVLGFVRAADKINVALDDLGSGATLTLSKLTGIFGEEGKYGTEASLLRVGSVINELSQNCSASAPYIANFTERLGGVGAQAKMTIPQIMGFASVLDSNAQKVEASATALSQVIVRLYQDPAKYAKVAGLDVKEFSDLMRKDANEALILFLETLNQAGGMDVLSPMFKDMGENGSRAISALSTLANNISQVKAQQEVANIAFNEGVSIDKEFAVQNNTVQASLEKCKNKANELRIELGQRLYPLMSHFLTTGAAIMRILLTTIKFVGQNADTIGVLTAATIAWTLALNASTVSAKLHTIAILATNKAEKAAVVIHKALIGLMSVMRLGVTAVTNAFLYFKNGLNVTYAMQERWRKSMASMSFASWTGLILAVASAVYLLYKRHKKLEEELKVVEKIRAKANEQMGEEKAKIDLLIAAAKNEELTLEERNKAITKLNAIIPNYNAQLDETTGKYKANKKALDEYIKSLTRKYELEGAKDKLAEIGKQKAQATIKQKEAQEAYDQASSASMSGGGYTYTTSWGAVGNTAIDATGKAWRDLNQANDELDIILAKEKKILDVYGVDLQREAANEQSTGEQGNSTGNDGHDGSEVVPSGTGYTHHETDKERRAREAAARRAAIKEKQEFKSELNDTKGVWEKESAQNTSDYSAGLKSWTEFLEKKHELEMQYFADREQVYEKYDLLEDEDYQALLKKKAEAEAEWLKRKAAMAVEDAKREQAVEEMQANSDFYNKESVLYKNEEALQMRLFDIKVKYMKKMQAAYNKDSQEWHDYQLKIEDAEGQESLRRKKLLVSRMAEWRKSYEYLEAGKRMYMELELLIDAYAEGLISYEDYLKAKEDLRKKYRDESIPDSAKPSENSQEAKAKNKDKDLERVQSLYDQGLLTEEEYNKARERIEKAFFDSAVENARRFGSEQTNKLLDIYVAWQDFFNNTEEDGGNWATRLAAIASSVFAVMNAGLQSASELMSAQADIDVAVAEKKYDREIELAQGNSYKVAKLEKKKETEIAKIKSEASKKQYAMQVIQAVAQTATNALNAYGSAAAIPVVGHILAPIAAAMAVAAGMVQIATIKKQQQAAEAKGYSQGGYTKPGAVDEPAGIVHAGEWVASQRLLASPVARPMIEVLDKAQRTNTIGSLGFDPAYALPSASSEPAMATADTSNLVLAAAAAQMSKVVSALHQRLNEPFVTVNTVTGDKGIKSAQDEYSRLISNKSPKSRR